MLDVDRGPHIDAGAKELFDVLPPLRMARRRLAADNVGMRKLIDEQDRRPPRESGIEIELLSDDPSIADSDRG